MYNEHMAERFLFLALLIYLFYHTMFLSHQCLVGDESSVRRPCRNNFHAQGEQKHCSDAFFSSLDQQSMTYITRILKEWSLHCICTTAANFSAVYSISNKSLRTWEKSLNKAACINLHAYYLTIFHLTHNRNLS